MKINAICVVKNEADVIKSTLLNAMKFCHRIYVFDNGSDDGTWEIIQLLDKHYEQIVIAQRSSEVFKNQLRNRVYNMFHHEYSADDWWYILDADEMLTESPAAKLKQAARAGNNCMYAWFAQFYFTDKDMLTYHSEDQSLPVMERRHYYRINWREIRFFKNDPEQVWPETVSGRIPYFMNKMHSDAPILRHYAERTPEQIKQRVNVRKNNPYSFLHVRNKKPNHQWVKQADTLFYYNNDGKFQFPLADRIKFHLREAKFWCQWRWKSVAALPQKLCKLMAKA